MADSRNGKDRSHVDEVEIIASRFHGGLALAHAVAVWFNLRRKNYWDAGIHALFVVYDLASAIRHAQDADGHPYESYNER